MYTILCDAVAATDAAATAQSSNGYTSILMIVAIFVVFYFFMIRPQQKKQKEIQKMRSELTRGDRVVTAGGIYGVINEVADKYFIIEVAKGVSIRVDKNSVYRNAEDAQAEQQQKENAK